MRFLYLCTILLSTLLAQLCLSSTTHWVVSATTTTEAAFPDFVTSTLHAAAKRGLEKQEQNLQKKQQQQQQQQQQKEHKHADQHSTHSSPSSTSSQSRTSTHSSTSTATTKSTASTPASPSSSSSTSSSKLPSDYHPLLPGFPSRFRFKARVQIAGTDPDDLFSFSGQSNVLRSVQEVDDSLKKRKDSKNIPKPYLLLYHYDAVKQRIREDFYTLVTKKFMHRKTLSTIKLFKEQQEWSIFHKQPTSPRACFQIPFSSLPLSFISDMTSSSVFSNLRSSSTPTGIEILSHSRSSAPMTHLSTQLLFQPHLWKEYFHYQGLTLMRLNDHKNVTLLHYRIMPLYSHEMNQIHHERARNNSFASSASATTTLPVVHLYVQPHTYQPVVLLTPTYRVDILSFQDAEQTITPESEQIQDENDLKLDTWDKLFHPQLASKAPCLSLKA